MCVHVFACELVECDVLPARRAVHPATRHRYWWVAATEGTTIKATIEQRTWLLQEIRLWSSQCHWWLRSPVLITWQQREGSAPRQEANLLRFCRQLSVGRMQEAIRIHTESLWVKRIFVVKKQVVHVFTPRCVWSFTSSDLDSRENRSPDFKF